MQITSRTNYSARKTEIIFTLGLQFQFGKSFAALFLVENVLFVIHCIILKLRSNKCTYKNILLLVFIHHLMKNFQNLYGQLHHGLGLENRCTCRCG